MKRVGLLFATLSLCVSGAWAQPSGQISTLHAAAALSNAEASQHMPVSFEAIVTYYRGSYFKGLFVQERGDSIYVHATTNLKLTPGDRVLVRGTIHESFRPYVESNDITLLGHGALPKPEHPSFEQMNRAETDGKLIAVRALIRSADFVVNMQSSDPIIELRMLVDGGQVDATILNGDESLVKDLLDADVEITGVQGGVFDNKMQQTGILIQVQSPDGVRILQRAHADPWSLPAAPMDRIILAGYRTVDNTQRLRVEGTVTYYQPGAALVLQDGPRSLWIATGTYSPLRIGDRASAIGFPDVQNGFLTLTRSEVRDSSIQAPVAPSLFSWRELALGGNEGHSRAFDLVSVEGQVVAEVRQATRDEYVLESDGHLLSAIIRHPGSGSSVPNPPMREIPLGTHIRVTGICMLADASPYNGEVPFDILMRSLDDIQIVSSPPWLTVRHLVILVGLLLLGMLAVGVRGWFIERKVRRQTAAVAYLERRRRGILEDINGSRPLAQIIEQITELVSFRLRGAPCWCQIADRALLGNRPPSLTTLRVTQIEIPARSGTALGTIFAAFDALTKPCTEESEALSMGAGLARLAIETSRLYSDLVHRSEFDLLTDVQNRFAMEKTLNAMIQTARETTGIFGLIFIDLDHFKQVNDQYGHQVGDIYLQQATLRMKHQLRPGDTLARLGGDEFAVVVAAVQNRSDVHEIARRLENCFDEPFAVGGHVVYGSASVGLALYPEDAASADSLLSTADAAMYVIKQSRSNGKQGFADGATPNLASKKCA